MRLERTGPWLRMPIVLFVLLLLGCAPSYDPKVDELITGTQTRTNALIERLRGQDQLVRLLQTAARPVEPAKLDTAVKATSFAANLPAYEELRTNIIALNTRMLSRGDLSTPKVRETLTALQGVLVAPPARDEPPTSMAAVHARQDRLSDAFLQSTQTQANALLQTLLTFELGLK